jgi:hypothetical protein
MLVPGLDRNGVADDAALVAFDRHDLAGLALGAHVLVDDPDAAFQGHRDRQARLRDRVHRGRDKRDLERDPAGQLGLEIDLVREHPRVRRNKEDVVEGECFLDQAHGEAPQSVTRTGK